MSYDLLYYWRLHHGACIARSIPFSVYQKLRLGELKPTSITLQLVDRSVREPRGTVEDVLVKIEQFYYPIDFIVLDY